MSRRTTVRQTERPQFTVSDAITCSLIYRGDQIFQSCKTRAAAQALADLLNHAVDVVDRHRLEAEITAAAVARAFDWRLELPADRARRLAGDDGRAQRLKGRPRSANPHAAGTELFEEWDFWWAFEERYASAKSGVVTP